MHSTRSLRVEEAAAGKADGRQLAVERGVVEDLGGPALPQLAPVDDVHRGRSQPVTVACHPFERGVPRVVFSDPEIAAVGLTQAQARQREAGHEVVTATVSLPAAISRPWTYERDPRGELGLVAHRARRVLLGAWAVAPLAGEWIHKAALAVRAEVPIDVLLDGVAQFPTYSEGFLAALEQLR